MDAYNFALSCSLLRIMSIFLLGSPAAPAYCSHFFLSMSVFPNSCLIVIYYMVALSSILFLALSSNTWLKFCIVLVKL